MKTEPQWRLLLTRLASYEQDTEKRQILLKEIHRLSEEESPKKRPQFNGSNVRAA